MDGETLQQPQMTIQIRKRDGNWTRSAKEKALAFAEHMKNVFKPHLRSEETNATQMYEYLEAPATTISSYKPLFTERNRKSNKIQPTSKKAPGYGLITGKLLKELRHKGVILLTTIFNAVLRLRHFPS